MSNHYFLVDDGRNEYVDCDKYLLDPDAFDKMDDFAAFLSIANMGEKPPPEKSNRYVLCETDARKLFDWMRAAKRPIRIVSLDSDGYETVEEYYTAIPLYPVDW